MSSRSSQSSKNPTQIILRLTKLWPQSFGSLGSTGVLVVFEAGRADTRGPGSPLIKMSGLITAAIQGGLASEQNAGSASRPRLSGALKKG